MGSKKLKGRSPLWLAMLCFFGAAQLASVKAQAPAAGISIVYFTGTVEVLRAGSAVWTPASTNQVLNAGDRVRTRPHSRLTLRLSDQDRVRFRDITEFQVRAPTPAQKKSGLNLLQGMLFLFHRGKPAEYDIQTPTATAAIRGTEFALEAQQDGPNRRTIITVVDGTV